MTNRDLQAELDKEKYLRGYYNNCDNSGQMWYCEDCQYQIKGYHCALDHKDRLDLLLCAKNAKKLKKAKTV